MACYSGFCSARLARGRDSKLCASQGCACRSRSWLQFQIALATATVLQIDRTTRYAEAMESISTQPNVISFNATISACDHSGCWKHHVQLLDSMASTCLKCSLVSINAAESSCARALQWLQARSWVPRNPCTVISSYYRALHLAMLLYDLAQIVLSCIALSFAVLKNRRVHSIPFGCILF